MTMATRPRWRRWSRWIRSATTLCRPRIHAGGLRYHGVSPLLAALHRQGYVEAVAYNQVPVFDAAALFTRTEGIIPAPESAHAIRAAIDEALGGRRGRQRPQSILEPDGARPASTLSAYDAYLAGELRTDELPEAAIAAAELDLPKVG